ncbi:MAG: ureidoglycolate lyase, partial [Phyllobacterium sp.]
MKYIPVRPLSRPEFAPFGDIIDLDAAKSYPINAGKCIRYHDLAKVEAAGPGARTIVSLLRGEPYELPLKLK